MILRRVKTYKVALCVGLAIAAGASAQEISLDPTSFIVRLEFSKNQLTVNGVTSFECAFVAPSGHIHLEHRYQQLPSTQASIRVYEGALGDDQLSRLRDLLGDKHIRELPEFAPFGIAGSVAERLVFIADISRGTQIQRVGYVEWKTAVQTESERTKVDALARTEATYKSVLQPLQAWFAGVNLQKLTMVTVAPSSCGTGPQ